MPNINNVPTTQYVGPKIVPHFANPAEWDINSEYDALSIVTNGGNTYWAKYNVPSGIDISNTEYWYLSAYPDAQIQQYRAEVMAFDDRITANSDANIAQAEQLAGTTQSGLKTMIENNVTNIMAELNKISDAKSGTVIEPNYVGDFMENGSFGCCCRAADKMYAFSYDGWNGYGNARIFNLSTNELINTKNILVGHANSCAYDSVRNRIWIVPMSTYSNGTSTYTNQIYYYDENLINRNSVSFNDETFMWGVSFDPVTENLYAFATYSGEGPITVYKMSNNENAFTLFTTITNEKFNTQMTGSIYTFQDFAVYNDILYAVKPEGTAFCINLNNNELIWTFRIGMTDAGNIWRYGEVEGIEFDSNGNLYNARNALIGYTNAGEHGAINCAFVTSLNMPWSIKQSDQSRQTCYGTLTLVTSNVFRLDRSQIRSLNQLNWRILEGCTHAITIPAGTTYNDGIVRLENLANIEIIVNGTMHLTGTLYDFGTNLYIYSDGGSIIGDASNFIQTAGFTIVTYRSRNNATVTVPSRFVYTGYSPTIVVIQGLPSGQTLKITEYDRGNCICSGNYIIKDFT